MLRNYFKIISYDEIYDSKSLGKHGKHFSCKIEPEANGSISPKN